MHPHMPIPGYRGADAQCHAALEVMHGTGSKEVQGRWAPCQAHARPQSPTARPTARPMPGSAQCPQAAARCDAPGGCAQDLLQLLRVGHKGEDPNKGALLRLHVQVHALWWGAHLGSALHQALLPHLELLVPRALRTAGQCNITPASVLLLPDSPPSHSWWADEAGRRSKNGWQGVADHQVLRSAVHRRRSPTWTC